LAKSNDYFGWADFSKVAAIAQNLRRMAKWLVPELPKGELIPV